LGARGTFPTLNTRRGRGACWGSGIRLGRGTSYLVSRSCIQNQPQVNLNSFCTLWVLGQATGNSNSFDSPRPGLAGSHHLPPYIILCSSTRRLHPNGSFSRDSQSGVPKLSQFGLPGLWAFITSRPELGSGQGLNQSRSSRQDLFNAMLHSCWRRRGRVDSRLLVVGSQIANLTPGPSFAHSLGCRCPNRSCESILDIYTPRPFQWHKEHSNARRFDPWNWALHFWESRKTPTSHFWECGLHPHTYPKVGLRQFGCGPRGKVQSIL
jgi:hypothetical protein